MNKRDEEDLLLRWGHEAAVLIFVLAVFIALAMVIINVVKGGDMERSTKSALLVLVLGAALGYGLIRVRKWRERAVRPAWMGSTQEWSEELQARMDDEAGGGNSPAQKG